MSFVSQFIHQFTTPLGEMRAVFNEAGALMQLHFLESSSHRLIQQNWVSDSTRAEDLIQQLQEYFAGKRHTFEIPLAPKGTDFQKKVWAELGRILWGTTISYGELARRLGNPAASRAVGRANATNPICVIIPCHRVIGKSGALTGYAYGTEIKQRLLELEGVTSLSFKTEDLPVNIY